MKKIFSLIIIGLALITFTGCTEKSFAFDFQGSILHHNSDGYFQKVTCPFQLDTQISMYPVKLKDGKILFIDDEGSILFDPSTNKFKRSAKSVNNNQQLGQGILLNNEKVIFFNPIVDEPSESAIHRFDKGVKFSSNKEYKNYINLPESEKEKIYLPTIKNNPEIYAKYEQFKKDRELSLYGILYDPKTEKFEYTGKLNVRVSNFPNINKTKLKDGRVFAISWMNRGGIITRSVEIYDPSTEKFSLVQSPDLKWITYVILLDDGRVFVYGGGFYSIFNPENNTFSECKMLNYFDVGNMLKLNDGRIFFIAKDHQVFKTVKKAEIHGNKSVKVFDARQLQLTNTMSIKAYDPKTDSFSTIGNLLIPRGENHTFNAKLLKDGRVLIFGGQNNIENYRMGYDKITPRNDVEIFDPKTGKSKIINKTNYYRGHIGDYFQEGASRSILLDDGRLFIYNRDCEMYIPKGYKKLKEDK